MSEIEIQYPKLHDGQRKIWQSRKRYNGLRCGRRYGKSTLGEFLMKHGASTGDPVAYFTPTYKDLQPMWDRMKSDMEPIITEKSETQHYMKLITGTQLDFWSLDDPDSGRGRFYKRAVIDEAAKVKKLEYAWTQTIRPTLVDLAGDVWFLTTGQGVGSYYHKLFTEAQSNVDWFTYTAPTSENPYISPAEIEEARRTMHPLAFQQEIMGEDVSWSEHAWCYAFEDRHIAGDNDVLFNPNQTVYLSFDFNVDPICCSAHQFGDGFYYTIQEFRIENSDTTELCKRIKGSELGACHFIVTGDATGRRRDTRAGNRNDYTIIVQELGINYSQVKVPTSNPNQSESRTLTNSIFARHPNRKVHPNCKYFIADLRFVQAKGDEVDKSDGKRSHFIDTCRYMDATFFPNFVHRLR